MVRFSVRKVIVMPDQLKIGNHSDVGNVRKTNEDYYGTFDTPSGTLIVVCDGMGGYTGGSKASRLAVEHIRAHFTENQFQEEYRILFEGAFAAAHHAITHAADEDEELKQMGSTAVVLLIREGKAYYAHAGDSPLYLIRNNEITQLTKDHSYVQQLLDNNLITEEEAKEHPRKNVITKALGNRSDAVPDVCAEPLTIGSGDRFVLCTDGLSNYFLMEELKQEVLKADPQQVCMNLVTIAKERGGKDNITVQVVEVVSADEVAVPASDSTKADSPAETTISGTETTIIEKLASTAQVSEKSAPAKSVPSSPAPAKKSFIPFLIPIVGLVLVAVFLFSKDYLFQPGQTDSTDSVKSIPEQQNEPGSTEEKKIESQTSEGPVPERDPEVKEPKKVQKPDSAKTKKRVPEKEKETKNADGSDVPKPDGTTVEKKEDGTPPKEEDVPKLNIQ